MIVLLYCYTVSYNSQLLSRTIKPVIHCPFSTSIVSHNLHNPLGCSMSQLQLLTCSFVLFFLHNDNIRSAWKKLVCCYANPFELTSKIIPNFQSQLWVMFMSLYFILKPEVLMSWCYIRDNAKKKKENKLVVTVNNRLGFMLVLHTDCYTQFGLLYTGFHFSQSCVCLIWTGMTISLIGSLTDVPGAGASMDRTPSQDNEELMCCRSTPCGSLYFRVKHLDTDPCSSCLSSWFPDICK